MDLIMAALHKGVQTVFDNPQAGFGVIIDGGAVVLIFITQELTKMTKEGKVAGHSIWTSHLLGVVAYGFLVLSCYLLVSSFPTDDIVMRVVMLVLWIYYSLVATVVMMWLQHFICQPKNGQTNRPG